MSGAWFTPAARQEDERDYDDYGLAPSSCFASTSARSMPWDPGGGRGVPSASQPAPGAYDVSGYRAMATLKSPHSAKSAAFASSAGRFPKTRAAGSEAYLDPSDDNSMTRSGGGTILQRSASFASTSRRLKEQKTISPGPGAYTPTTASAYTPRSIANMPSASYASGSSRSLPYERTVSAAPPPTCYQPSPAEEYRGRGHGPGLGFKADVSSKSAASMRLTSPRFADGHYSRYKNELPGPGAYNALEADPRTLASAYSTTGKRLPATTSERRVFEGDSRTPGAGTYEPYGPAAGGCSGAFVPSASFRSTSSRLKPHKTISPGPGNYEPNDGLATASQAGNRPTIRRSASFGSTSQRFRSKPTDVPGPGSYHRTMPYKKGSLYASGSVDDSAISPRFQKSTAAGTLSRSPRRAVGTNSVHLSVSASFASGSERTQLPNNRSAREVPGPGSYPSPNPIADYARPVRRSASFASTSERLRRPPKAATSTPPPGAYDPQLVSKGRAHTGASVRYSMHSDSRAGVRSRARGYRSNLG